MKRLLGGGRMKWAHPVAKLWKAGIAVAALAILGTLWFAPPAKAAIATSGKWLNRMYIVDNNGQNYFDSNTYDDDYRYVEQNPIDGCADAFSFRYTGIDGADPFRNANFFYDLTGPYSISKLPNSLWYVTLQESVKFTNGSGGEECGKEGSSAGYTPHDNIPLDVNNNARRITFYKNTNDQIISFKSNITFNRNGDFKGVARYVRGDEAADSNNSCKDIILMHAANINTGGEAIFGRGEIAGSSMLYAVRHDGDLGRTAESYDRATEPNSYGRNNCQIEGDAMNGRKNGHYGISGYDDNSHDKYYLAGGLQDNGTPATGGDEDDDAVIIFIGTMDNVPKDASNTPITNPGAPDGGDKTDQQVCKGGAMGWVICPIVSAIQAGADLIKDTMQKLLTVNPLPLGTGQPIYDIWNNIRNFANIAFVIAFFFIIFSQATSIGISNYGIKRMLPRLVLVAIVTNLSYFICAFLVDFFNVLGVGVYNLIAIVNGGSQGTVDVSNGAGAVLVGLGAAGAAAAFYTGAVVQLFPLLAAAFIGMLITFIILVVRQAAIVILVAISPLIAVAFLLDGTRQWGKKGLDIGSALLLMYPLIMLLFGGARLAGAVLTAAAQGTKLGTLVEVVGLIIQVVMGFAAIFLFKWAIVAKGALGRVAGNLNDRTKGLTNRAKEFGENRNYYQRRQFARDARKQEQRRANVADYANRITGTSRSSALLRRRAAGGLTGQLFNTNQAGQERQRLSGVAQLEKQEHEETQQAGLLIESARVTSPGQLAQIAMGRTATGVDGQTINGAGNRALQLAAIQKIIKAQDAGAIESLFRDPGVDKNMLVSELQKEQNYSTSKGAGAHFVQMQPRTYQQHEIDAQAAISMSALAADKLATQDGPAWDSAARGFAAGAGTLNQRRALYDQVQAIYADDRARNNLKGSARKAFNDILNSTRP